MRSRISRTYRRTAYALQVLTVVDDDGVEQTLRVTAEHPFFTTPGGWTPAKSLRPGDRLAGVADGLTVRSNTAEPHPAGVTVYNLEVEQSHTYFVLAEHAADSAAVWVHNAEYVDPAKGAKPRYSPDPEKWVRNGGGVWNEMDGTWVYQNAEGVSVRYPNGFPDFEGAGLVRQSVNIETVPDRYFDFINADAAAPMGARLPTNTWHHHENLTTMQEIDWAIHDQFRHQGGVSLGRSR